LVTNTDHSDFAKSHASDGEKISNLLLAVRGDWSFKVYDCTEGVFPNDVNECDGYVIGGSPESVNSGSVWVADLFKLIRHLDDMKYPTIGCCFGHQAIAKALGGVVSKNTGGWAFGVSQTEFIQFEPWMVPKANPLLLYAAHSEQVSSLPQKAETLGGSAFCPIGSFKVGTHFFTTQYHPEMTDDFFNGLSFAFAKYVGEDVAQNAREQAKQPAQGWLFAEWMAKFFELPHCV
jgi:GMP synthase-like glutamine amidotransferase